MEQVGNAGENVFGPVPVKAAGGFVEGLDCQRLRGDPLRALAVDRSRAAIGAGGDFTVVNGRPRKRYASFS